MVLYHTRGLNNADKSAAIQIFEALDRAISVEANQSDNTYADYLELLERYLELNPESITQEEKIQLSKLISTSMGIMSTNTMRPRSALL
jgi:hypothetical protein